MNRNELAENLAVSITAGPWSVVEIAAVLERRLPPVMRKHAQTVAKAVHAACPGSYAPIPRVAATILADAHCFGRVYGYCRRYNLWPAPDLTPPRMAPVAAFADLPLPSLATLDDLADWLGLPLERLTYQADPSGRHETHGETAINHYHYNLLPKRGGGVRLIEAPKQRHKALQRRILRGILDRVPAHPDAFGFVRGRNCLDAAARHAGEEVVIGLDVQNFFPAMNGGRVFGVFRSLGYPQAVARCLTGLCTTRTPARVLARLPAEQEVLYQAVHLPQGAPTSPALANLVAFGLDIRLSALARSVGAQYSRYADDISFSGDRGIAGILLHMAVEILREEGFTPHPNKTRIMGAGGRQTVTGVVVNRHLNVTRQRFDRLKAVIHACGKPNDMRLQDPGFRANLLGQMAWVAAVNPRRGAKLYGLLERAATEPK